jgi:hypothetical protein
MRLEEYQRGLEDFWRDVRSNQEQMNKEKGETLSNPSLHENPCGPDDQIIGTGSSMMMRSRHGA